VPIGLFVHVGDLSAHRWMVLIRGAEGFGGYVDDGHGAGELSALARRTFQDYVFMRTRLRGRWDVRPYRVSGG